MTQRRGFLLAVAACLAARPLQVRAQGARVAKIGFLGVSRAENVAAGGLMSYGPTIEDQFHQAAAYVSRILKGANPAELPIEQPTRFKLVVNVGTAKALGLRLPQSILAQADELIK